ncbi:MAG: Ig-like domain repeat protein [Betaproteobacteria bacterium]
MTINAASRICSGPTPQSRIHALGAWAAMAAMGILLVLAPPVLAADVSSAAFVTHAMTKVVPDQFNGDLSKLPAVSGAAAAKAYRPLLRGPRVAKTATTAPPSSLAPQAGGGANAPMPNPMQNFVGLSKTDACTGGVCGGGWPPDSNGDVGPNHVILVVNSAVGIYNKTGTRLAGFTEDSLWSGVGTSACNGNSQGDPVVLYDWLADRFVLTWFAFAVNGSGDPISPYYQCIAASKTSDPVAGGWWLYAVRTDPGGVGMPQVNDLNDYGKFGLWHDCLYMASNQFTFPAGDYNGVAFGSFSRADLYSGAPLTYSLGWLPPSTNAFTLVPSNNLGKGAAAVQPGTPNYFVSESGTIFEYEVRKFTAGTNCGAGGTLGPMTSVSQNAYDFQFGAVVPQPNTTNKLDMIDDRIMQKVQYRRIGTTESLWVTHTVGAPTGNIGMQWAQFDVTGGTVATTPVQQQIHAPDSTLHRFMGSVAVDKMGNMALGYSTSGTTAPDFPSIAYAGRLATDPPNTLPQTETQLIAGTGSQTNNCGGAPCDRWGDYSSMSVDPTDDCTFWYVNQYYSSQGNGTAGNWQTRIGSFKFASCASTPATTTTVASSVNPSSVGGAVTLTSTTTGVTPTGTVAFTDNGVGISGCGAVALVGSGNIRTAACSTSALTLGAHTILASYVGDSGNAPSSGTVTQNVNAVVVPAVPLYRFNTGLYYFYTSSEAEKIYVQQTFPTWVLEGVAYYVYITAPVANTLPVYRFNTGTYHFYTISEAEKLYVQQTFPSWVLEGVAFRTYPQVAPQTLPVYRFNTGNSHFYTISVAEKNSILANFPSWTLEGIAYYARTAP